MPDRMRRINESIRHTLGDALPTLKDPRVGFVTVTAVRTTRDLREARVLVSVLGSEKKRARAMLALNSAHGVLQAAINRELRLKRIPQLTFEYDPTAEQAIYMTKLIKELVPDEVIPDELIPQDENENEDDHPEN